MNEECERCGSTENVKTELDPFALEVYNEAVEVTWCEKCFQNSRDDV
jgi:hypothetical protein